MRRQRRRSGGQRGPDSRARLGSERDVALNDVAGTGTSSLTVKGDVKVGPGALLAIGCEPNFSPCTDDPNAGTGGTLTGQNKVFGDIRASRALGVLLHASTIKGDVSLRGGGAVSRCCSPIRRPTDR